MAVRTFSNTKIIWEICYWLIQLLQVIIIIFNQLIFNLVENCKVNVYESCSVMSTSLQFHGLYPTRLLCPGNTPGNNSGVGCCDWAHKNNNTYHGNGRWKKNLLIWPFRPKQQFYFKEEIITLNISFSWPTALPHSSGQGCYTIHPVRFRHQRDTQSQEIPPRWSFFGSGKES